MLYLGSHVERKDPLHGAVSRQADVVQIFLSPPQAWAAPKLRGDEDALACSGLPIFVHAPYLANPASANPAVREKTRQCLQEQCRAAASVGSLGLVVHGGHPTGGGTVAQGIDNWLEVMRDLDPECRILIENTAGGSAAVARRFDDFARLLDALRGAGHDVGVVLDTCHAHAGGEELSSSAERLIRFAGSIELVHLNDSKDDFNSGRDNHQSLGEGSCSMQDLLQVVKQANTYTVVETPGDYADQARDLSVFRSALG